MIYSWVLKYVSIVDVMWEKIKQPLKRGLGSKLVFNRAGCVRSGQGGRGDKRRGDYTVKGLVSGRKHRSCV